MEQVDIWLNTRRFWKFVRPYRGMFFVMMFIVFLIESTILIERYLLKMFIDAASAFAATTLSYDGLMRVILIIVGIMAVFLAIRTIGKFVFIHVLNRIDGKLILDIKQYFFNHIVHLDHNFHTSNKTGSLISKMTRGGKSIETMMDSVAFSFSSLIFLLFVSVLALLLVGWQESLTLLLIVSAYVGFNLFIFKVQLPHNKKANDVEDHEKGTISDIFTNIDSIKYYGKEEAIKRRYDVLSTRTFKEYLHLWDYYRFADAGSTTILTLGVVVLMFFPIMGLLTYQNTVGDVVFVFTVYTGLVGPMFGFMFGVRNYYRSMTDFNSLYYYDQFTNTILDKDNAPSLNIKQGAVLFSNIDFGYDEGLFQDFTLSIEPHQKVALVGHSGSGKSTLVKLLYRLYDLEKGSIQIDGVDIRDVQQESLRSELAIVPQESILFDDTIWNNIKFSHANATDEEVRDAIKFAQLDRLIESLPKRENTIVGERGVRLSGGEKQRVGIARALLANKKILVLDEATSALDSQTEHEIQQDLKRLMEGRTAIIIAHRLSTIMAADKIVVLDDGKIVQEGTHAQLIKKKGPYKHLWELQRGGYIE